MELQNGRPEDLSGRLEREIKTYDLLDELGISYQRTDHEATDTMEECNEIDAILGVVICKNLFLCNKHETEFYLLMMPGDKPFRTKDVSHQIGSSRLSFASPENMYKHNRVQLLIDEDVLKDEYLGCHPCVNTSSLKIRTSDIIDRFLPVVNHNYITVHL